MARLNVTNEIKVYEINGKEASATIIVKNHWNIKDFVIIHVDGEERTVLAKDLIAAINNATNLPR